MSRRLTLDPSSFERLLAAALVLQHRHDQEARSHTPAPDEEPAKLSEADVEPRCVFERPTIGASPVALSELGETLEPAVNQDARPERPTAWKLLNASVGRCVGLTSGTLLRAHSFAITAISTAKYRQRLWAESISRYLREVQSLWLSALRSANQFFLGARGAVAQSFRRTMLSFLTVTNGAKSVFASFGRYRVKAWVTFDSKFTLSPRRALTKAATPLFVLLIMVTFTVTQIWPRGHFVTVAAVSRMSSPSDATGGKSEQFRPTSAGRTSHMQVTDPAVLSVVESLSRFEIPGLRRQARYGDDSAVFIMGMLYETGHFVPQSCTTASDWVASSANAGNAAAQYNLGLRYRDGDGVPANEDEAEKWLRRAAIQGYSHATLALETPASVDAQWTHTPPGITDELATGSVSHR